RDLLESAYRTSRRNRLNESKSTTKMARKRKRTTSERDAGAAQPSQANKGMELVRVIHAQGEIACVAWSPDGRRLATGGRGIAEIWDSGTGERLMDLQFSKQLWVHALAWSPNGERLATGTVRDWNDADSP